MRGERARSLLKAESLRARQLAEVESLRHLANTKAATNVQVYSLPSCAVGSLVLPDSRARAPRGDKAPSSDAIGRR
eukprot:9156693-Pyramimonas_sp.AAC.2